MAQTVIPERLPDLRGLLLISAAMTAWAADPAPEFSAAGVGLRSVVPGVYVSIYGRFLGPSTGCSDSAKPIGSEVRNPRAPIWMSGDKLRYPTRLCDTQVLIGNVPAGLLYVSDKQVNFKVPQDSPERGTVELRVVYQGKSSLPVTLGAGYEKTSVSLAAPAYVDMPLWLEMDLPSELTGVAHYPGLLGPAHFGCTEVLARRNGRLLPLLHGADWDRMGLTFAGSICGGFYSVGKQHDGLPVHLLYRFDVAGDYEVRFALYDAPWGSQTRTLREQSPWTVVRVRPRQLNQRALWLEDLRGHNPQDTAELLTKVLPSVLGIPDNASLEFLSRYLYHPDVEVRWYAFNGLNYWPDTQVVSLLETLLRTRGESDAVRRGLQQRQSQYLF